MKLGNSGNFVKKGCFKQASFITAKDTYRNFNDFKLPRVAGIEPEI